SRVLREDVENSALLFVGTEFAVWVSTNRGATWTKLNNNLPTVAVHELAIHPTAGEMVAATHGRSLWVLDVTPLRQMSADVHKVPWNLTRFASGMVGSGMYRIVLSVDGQEFTQSLHVENDPVVPNAVMTPPELGQVDKEQKQPRIDD